MSNVKLPDGMCNFNFYVKEVGKTIKSSKVKHTWEVTIDKKHHIVELFDSRMSGKMKVTRDGTVIFFEEEFSGLLSLPFTIDKHNCSLVQSGEGYEMRIDNLVFTNLVELERTKNLFGGNDPTSVSYKPQANNVSKKAAFGIGEVKKAPDNSGKPGMFNFSIKDGNTANKPVQSYNNKFLKLEDRSKATYHSNQNQVQVNQSNNNDNDDMFKVSENTNTNQANKSFNDAEVTSNTNNLGNLGDLNDLFSGLGSSGNEANQISNKSEVQPQQSEFDFTQTYDFAKESKNSPENRHFSQLVEPKVDDIPKKKNNVELDMFINNMGNYPQTNPYYYQQNSQQMGYGNQMYMGNMSNMSNNINMNMNSVNYSNIGTHIQSGMGQSQYPTYSAINESSNVPLNKKNDPFSHEFSINATSQIHSTSKNPQDNLDFFDTVKPGQNSVYINNSLSANNNMNFSNPYTQNNQNNNQQNVSPQKQNNDILDDFF